MFITKEQIDIIMKEPYQSSTKLSKELNIPASTIRGYRNKNNVFTKNIFIPPPNEEFIALYEQLKSSRAVARYYNTNHKTVLEHAHKIGYEPEQFDCRNIRKTLLDDEQIQEIIDSYDVKTSTYLANKFKVSNNLIAKIWKENNKIDKLRNKYSINHDYFSIIDSPQKAYFLGFIGADGCLYDKNEKQEGSQNIIRICIQSEDEKFLKLFKEETSCDKPIIYTKNNRYSSVEIVSQKMYEDIYNLGLKPRKTYSNTIAEIPEKLFPHLIRGYFDGDGCIHKDTISDVRISISGYKTNMEKIQRYLFSRHIFSSFTVDKRKYTKNENNDDFGALVITNRISKYCFLKLIYENSNGFYLDRKFNIANNFINYIEKSENTRDKQIKIYYDYAVQKVS